jgi:hypothetical protein
MYTKYIIYIFSMAIRPHVLCSWNIIKQIIIIIIMQFPFIKFPPFLYDTGFFLKKDIIMHSLLYKCKKIHFLNEI